jgi:IS5 family transposase
MEGRREAVATADELVESIRTLTDTVLEHAKSTDARIDALATEVRDLTTEVRDLTYRGARRVQKSRQTDRSLGDRHGACRVEPMSQRPNRPQDAERAAAG